MQTVSNHMTPDDYGTLIVVLVLYLLPALVASQRRHVNRTAIFILNLLLGWTFIGWIIALVWSFTAATEKKKT